MEQEIASKFIKPIHGRYYIDRQAFWCGNCSKWVSSIDLSQHERSEETKILHGTFNFDAQAFWCQHCACWISLDNWPTHIHTTVSSIKKTLSERKSTHGSFEQNANISQELKNIMRKEKNWEKLNYQMREALEQVALKVSRILSTSGLNSDDWHDIAGYATLVEQSLSQPKEQKDSPFTKQLKASLDKEGINYIRVSKENEAKVLTEKKREEK